MSERNHIVALDGLRGIAVILVILAHSNATYGGAFLSGFNGFVSGIMGAGWIGVDLFFALSGFLITGILLGSREDPNYFRNFYVRRALRIMPLYFGFLTLLLIAFYFRPGMQREAAGTRSLLLYYYNFYAAYTGNSVAYAHQFWSLAVEEHFYLIWPCIVLLCSNRTLIKICLTGAVLSLLFRVAVVGSGSWLQVAYLTTPCRIDGLLAGSAIAMASYEPRLLQALRTHARTAMCAAIALAVGIALGGRHFTDFVDSRRVQGPPTDSAMVLTLGIAALSIAFSLLIFLVVDGGPWHVLSNRALRLTGKYSFAIYVFHPVAVGLMLKASNRLGLSAINPIAGKFMMAVSVFAISYLAGWISYHAFEKHFLLLKRYFEGSYGQPPIAVAVQR